jgi:hypothetical protein
LGLAILTALTVVLSACGPQRPTTTFEPTIIGVIEESNAGYDEIIPLSTGENIDVTGAEAIGSAPTPGSLFLGGELDGRLWYQIALESAQDCPFHIASNLWNDGDFVLLESGLRLRKADTFTGEPIVFTGGPSPVLCIDADGRALKTN